MPELCEDTVHFKLSYNQDQLRDITPTVPNVVLWHSLR